MKKVLTVLIVLSCFFTAFAGATPEETKSLIQNLPSMVEQRQETVSSSSISTGENADSSNTGYAVIERDIAQLERLYKYIEKNYLFEIDHDKVYQSMAKAMLDSLGDKYSYYIEPQNSKDYEEQAMGKYGGIGIYFLTKQVTETNDENIEIKGFQVSQVFPNTPASKMGLLAKDLIIAVDGVPTADMSSNDCAAHMKGEVGSEVVLSIYRNGTTFDVTLVREVIYTPTVEYEMIDDENAYISILEFSEDTASKIKNALIDLSEKGMKGLIIDLRNNPGGDVDITLSIADMFIKDAELLRIYHKNSTKDVVYHASSDLIVDPSVKVVILINEGSASSSEIFSSTMRDNKRAVLVGATTYGKGIMQIVTTFGKAWISITNAKFVPPSGIPIHEQGVEPDYPVKSITLLDNEIESYRDFVLSGKAEEFVKLFPECTHGHVLWFLYLNRNTGLRDEVLQIVLRNAYYSAGVSDIKADIEFDPQLGKAYEILQEK